ncbi:hypothetical protein [uncultured Gammaproteobacteria bacterium]|nr:hypothetical protein [uncultured Gammaproteobacteria bacterium]
MPLFFTFSPKPLLKNIDTNWQHFYPFKHPLLKLFAIFLLSISTTDYFTHLLSN